MAILFKLPQHYLTPQAVLAVTDVPNTTLLDRIGYGLVMITAAGMGGMLQE
jgi:hypothetical protein